MLTIIWASSESQSLGTRHHNTCNGNEKFEIRWELPKCDMATQRNKCCWENGTDGRARGRLATTLPLVKKKNAVFANCNPVTYVLRVPKAMPVLIQRGLTDWAPTLSWTRHFARNHLLFDPYHSTGFGKYSIFQMRLCATERHEAAYVHYVVESGLEPRSVTFQLPLEK